MDQTLLRWKHVTLYMFLAEVAHQGKPKRSFVLDQQIQNWTDYIEFLCKQMKSK